jgi:hypothetical protein
MVNCVLDLEEANGEFDQTSFLCDAYRLYYTDPISQMPSGIFANGSNSALTIYKRNNFGKKAQFWHCKLKVSSMELAEKRL